MSSSFPPGAGRTVPPPAGSIDAQILATWRALLINPDLDPRHAVHAIDQFLDHRTRRNADSPRPAPPLNGALPPGSPVQQVVLAEVLAMLM